MIKIKFLKLVEELWQKQFKDSKLAHERGETTDNQPFLLSVPEILEGMDETLGYEGVWK